MSNKISGFTVTFKDSVSEEYMESVKHAIFLLKNVASVDGVTEDASTYIGESKEKFFITNKLLELISSDFNRKK
jgi:hypothetical protein